MQLPDRPVIPRTRRPDGHGGALSQQRIGPPGLRERGQPITPQFPGASRADGRRVTLPDVADADWDAVTPPGVDAVRLKPMLLKLPLLVPVGIDQLFELPGGDGHDDQCRRWEGRLATRAAAGPGLRRLMVCSTAFSGGS